MADHIKAAHALESACILICDANNHIDPDEHRTHQPTATPDLSARTRG